MRPVPQSPAAKRYASLTLKGNATAEYAWFAARAKTPLTSIPSRHAARQIVEASRAGRGRFIVTTQARLLALADALAPELTADAMGLMERFYLPAPIGPEGNRLVMAYEGSEAAVPSASNALVAEAVVRNNETNAPRP